MEAATTNQIRLKDNALQNERAEDKTIMRGKSSIEQQNKIFISKEEKAGSENEKGSNYTENAMPIVDIEKSDYAQKGNVANNKAAVEGNAATVEENTDEEGITKFDGNVFCSLLKNDRDEENARENALKIEERVTQHVENENKTDETNKIISEAKNDTFGTNVYKKETDNEERKSREAKTGRSQETRNKTENDVSDECFMLTKKDEKIAKGRRLQSIIDDDKNSGNNNEEIEKTTAQNLRKEGETNADRLMENEEQIKEVHRSNENYIGNDNEIISGQQNTANSSSSFKIEQSEKQRNVVSLSPIQHVSNETTEEDTSLQLFPFADAVGEADLGNGANEVPIEAFPFATGSERPIFTDNLDFGSQQEREMGDKKTETEESVGENQIMLDNSNLRNFETSPVESENAEENENTPEVHEGRQTQQINEVGNATRVDEYASSWLSAREEENNELRNTGTAEEIGTNDVTLDDSVSKQVINAALESEPLQGFEEEINQGFVSSEQYFAIPLPEDSSSSTFVPGSTLQHDADEQEISAAASIEALEERNNFRQNVEETSSTNNNETQNIGNETTFLQSNAQKIIKQTENDNKKENEHEEIDEETGKDNDRKKERSETTSLGDKEEASGEASDAEIIPNMARTFNLFSLSVYYLVLICFAVFLPIVLSM